MKIKESKRCFEKILLHTNCLKYWLILFLGMFIFTIGHTQERSGLIVTMNNVLKSKDTTGIGYYLAPEFAVAGHTGGGAKLRLNEVIKQYAPKSIRFLSKKKSENGLIYELEITEDTGLKIRSLALCNQKEQLIYLEKFDELCGLKREEKSHLIAQVPFENINGSIILQVHINFFHKPLRLLFDTGADGMAISQKLADEIGLRLTRESEASVVGGEQKIQVSDNNTVRIDTHILKGMGIAIFPEIGAEHIDGILGNVLFRRYITSIDYDRNLISLYNFGPFEYEGSGKSVKISMPSGLLLIPGDLEIVEGKTYAGRFVYDTGASYSMICFRPFVRNNKLLISGFKSTVQGSTVSLGISSPTFLGLSKRFSIKGLKGIIGLPVSLMGGSSSNEGWDPSGDGSIGVRLLSRYNMTINLAEGEVFFSPNKLYRFPQDFLLKNYQFGWNNRGELSLLGVVGSGGLPRGLSSGMRVTGMGAYTADKLASEVGLIEELKRTVNRGEELSIKFENNKNIEL